ncbi:MAG: oxidoreductase [Lachnospiraceae bacterium]|nr:oxidoreductase [Candidatus Equihabitans merdae]
MIGNTSKCISADSLTGILFGVEGIRNVIVLLNGPMGCKFYHSTTSHFLMDRPPLYLPVTEDGRKVEVDYNYMNDWFFRQSQVPCTYLDTYDYVYGSADKVEEAMRYIRDHVNFDLFVVVNSPGASLIGDNLKELTGKVLPDKLTVHIESPGFSESYAWGYEAAAINMLKQLSGVMLTNPSELASTIMNSKSNTDGNSDGFGIMSTSLPKSINLLGLSIWHRYAAGDREELVRLFEKCGVKVNCCLFSGCSLEEIKAMPRADLNIVIHPDMALETARYLEETYGTPYYVCDGPPIGFEATERLFEEISARLDVDISSIITELEQARGTVWYKVNQIYTSFGLPKGVTFAVEGSLSMAYSYTRFMGEYLGMTPECVAYEEAYPAYLQVKMTDLLSELQAENTLCILGNANTPDSENASSASKLYDTKAELVFSNANVISSLMTRRDAFCGIEISLPGMGYTDIIPKTHLGIRGTMFLTEQILNGLMSKL